MLKVSLINPNFQTGPVHLNSYYLPYSLGTLWTYATQDDIVKNNFSIHNWVFRRDPLEVSFANSKDADVALFSIYVWNKEYCYALAKMLKEHNPAIKIIFGGPEVKWRDPQYLTTYSFIDTICINEGEQAVTHLLKLIANGEELPPTTTFERIQDLDLPSPYLNGLFDDLMAQHPDIEWVPTLETDRGCPYQCTFCDWGSATGSKMFKFYMERIKAEIDWFADHGLPYVSMTNSNFGAFKERDLQIAKWLGEANKRTGHPTGLSVSYAKNSNSTVVEIVKTLIENNIQNGMYVSLQSTDEKVLNNIKRANMKINKLGDLKAVAENNNLPLYTDLILGLPGENKETWYQNIENVFTADIINMDVYLLQLLVNAPMYVNDLDEYKIKTFDAYDYFYETNTDTILKEVEEGIAESINVIQSTSTMSNQDLVECAMYSWFVLGMHCYGITTFVANYCKNKKDISYTTFYKGLFEYLKTTDEFTQWCNDFKMVFDEWNLQGYTTSKIGGIKAVGWQLIFSLMPILQHNRKIPWVIDKASTFIETHLNIGLDVVDDFKQVANYTIKQYDNYLYSPVTIDMQSDLLDCKTITVKDRYNQFPESFEQHLDYIFFGRRRNWATNQILRDQHV